MIKLMGLQVFDGPSVYSHKPAARLSLKMEEYIDTPSTEIEGLYSHLLFHFPGLKTHFCSKGHAGGFLERLREGTYLAHIIEHLCLEIQSVLGYSVKYGKTRRAEGDDYDIVIGYENKQIIEPCVHFIMDFIISFLKKTSFDFAKGFSQIKEINKREVLDLYRPVSAILVSVAGAGNKTILCRAVSSMLQKAGCQTGTAANYAGAKKILDDSTYDAVVLESNWQSILQDGLAYSKADICIFTGLEGGCLKNSCPESAKDQDWMEEMLHIQSLTVEAVKQDGASLLNADDAYVVPLMERAKGRIILYGKNENTPVMKNHMNRGGEVIFIEKGSVISVKDRYKQRLAQLRDIAMQAGLSENGIYAALAAAAACSALGFYSNRKDNYLLQKLGAMSTSSV